MKLTDEQIVEWWEDEIHLAEYVDSDYCDGIKVDCIKLTLDLINRKDKRIAELELEKERDYSIGYHLGYKQGIKELSDKITEIFMRYAHLHSYAEQSRQDYIETVDGYEIEMQSVWDVFSLKKYEMAEYEEMSRLQKNIETIEKERLLTELEKDFRLLVKEMVG